MKKSIILIFLALFVMNAGYGCGYREGARQPDARSYIWFSGNTKGATAVIDDNPPFEIDSTSYTNSRGETVKREGKTLYELSPGKHEVVVKRGSEVIVHRVILINSGASKEVVVP